jgi:hypothetical protein
MLIIAFFDVHAFETAVVAGAAARSTIAVAVLAAAASAAAGTATAINPFRLTISSVLLEGMTAV